MGVEMAPVEESLNLSLPHAIKGVDEDN